MGASLPLDDRILFACSQGARSVTELARKLKVAKPSIYPVVNRLVELGLLVAEDERARVTMYEPAAGVAVDYGPRGVEVDVDGNGDPRKDKSDRCAATTTQGSRCQKAACDGSEFCSIHAPTATEA